MAWAMAVVAGTSKVLPRLASMLTVAAQFVTTRALVIAEPATSVANERRPSAAAAAPVPSAADPAAVRENAVSRPVEVGSVPLDHPIARSREVLICPECG